MASSSSLRPQLNSHLHSQAQLPHLQSRSVKFNGVRLKVLRRANFKIRAVAEVNRISLDQRTAAVHFESSGDDLAGLDERERSRRQKISTANKGSTPWNKGKRHSAETIQRIRERTRLAMQSPKVRMKLANLGHKQSKETKMKIGAGVRIGWTRRRKKLMVQETCIHQWKNLIAEASRLGLDRKRELQWDSYKILNEQLEQEWLQAVEERKVMCRLKGGKQTAKSAEQKRKIAEAIAAKWADPNYRERVCSGMAKYHGTNVGSERKSRRRTSSKTQFTEKSMSKNKADDIVDASNLDTKGQIKALTLRRSDKSLYKDPLVSSKLEMIKNIRAQRAAAETQISEAVERARLLVVQAQKAAKTLELAAVRSPTAFASLMETRKLIAEAVQLIECVETGQIVANETERDALEKIPRSEDKLKIILNGNQRPVSSTNVSFDFDKFTLQNLLNGQDVLLPSHSHLSPIRLDDQLKSLNSRGHVDQMESNRNSRKSSLPNVCQSDSHPNQERIQQQSVSVKKKWVRGRLIEVRDVG